MTRRQILMRGLVAGLLIGLAAQAANWLLSAHPNASEGRRIAVVLQAAFSVIGAIWLARGIPGEPALRGSDLQELSSVNHAPELLGEGTWRDPRESAAAHSPSPIPHRRPV